ncbi:hypothetical protein JCM3765_002015 [Sporobolomyces pararoseus]
MPSAGALFIAPSTYSTVHGYIDEGASNVNRVGLGIKIPVVCVGDTRAYRIGPKLPQNAQGYLQFLQRVIDRSNHLGTLDGSPLLNLDYIRYIMKVGSSNTFGLSGTSIGFEFRCFLIEDFKTRNENELRKLLNNLLAWWNGQQKLSILPPPTEAEQKRLHRVWDQTTVLDNRPKSRILNASESFKVNIAVCKVATFKGMSTQDYVEEKLHQIVTFSAYEIAHSDKKQSVKSRFGLIGPVLSAILNIRPVALDDMLPTLMGTGFFTPHHSRAPGVQFDDPAIAVPVGEILETLEMGTEDFAKLFDGRVGAFWHLSYIKLVNSGGYCHGFEMFRESISCLKDVDHNRLCDGVIRQYRWGWKQDHSIVGHSVNYYDDNNALIPRRTLKELTTASRVDLKGRVIEDGAPLPKYLSDDGIKQHIKNNLHLFGLYCVQGGHTFDKVMGASWIKTLSTNRLYDSMTVDQYISRCAEDAIDVTEAHIKSLKKVHEETAAARGKAPRPQRELTLKAPAARHVQAARQLVKATTDNTSDVDASASTSQATHTSTTSSGKVLKRAKMDAIGSSSKGAQVEGKKGKGKAKEIVILDSDDE